MELSIMTYLVTTCVIVFIVSFFACMSAYKKGHTKAEFEMVSRLLLAGFDLDESKRVMPKTWYLCVDRLLCELKGDV